MCIHLKQEIHKRKGAIKIAITSREILIPKKLPRARVEKELEFDFPLPEFCPDISRIIRVDCTPFSDGVEVEDGRATVRGRAVFDILYETDYKSRLRNVSFSQEFSQTVPVNSENATAHCRLACEKIGCKLQSPRRLVAKATVSATFSVESDTTVKALSASDGNGVYYLKKDLVFSGKTELFADDAEISESFSLNQTEKSISETVCGSVFLQSPTVTVRDGEAEFKTTATVHALCEEEKNEGHYYVSQKSLPVTVLLKNQGITEDSTAFGELEVRTLELKTDLDQYGESRIIKANMTVRATLYQNRLQRETVAEDVFEQGFEFTPVVSSASFPLVREVADAPISVETSVDPMSPRPESLLDISVSHFGGALDITDGGITVTGRFVMTILAKTEDGIRSFDRHLPYTKLISLDSAPENPAAEIYVIEPSATLSPDGSATLKLIAGAKITETVLKTERFVSDIGKKTARSEDIGEGEIVFCFPSEGEGLWDIAKTYRVDPDGLRSTNVGLFGEGGELTEKKPIKIGR